MLVLRGGNTEGLINFLTLNVYGTKPRVNSIYAENEATGTNDPNIFVGDYSSVDDVDGFSIVDDRLFKIV